MLLQWRNETLHKLFYYRSDSKNQTNYLITEVKVYNKLSDYSGENKDLTKYLITETETKQKSNYLIIGAKKSFR